MSGPFTVDASQVQGHGRRSMFAAAVEDDGADEDPSRPPPPAAPGAGPPTADGGARPAPSTTASTAALRHGSTPRVPSTVTGDFHAGRIWAKGYTGKGVAVAVFDTGLRKGHPHFKRVVERTNWTSERTLDDGLGHGTFVAGVIASTSADCPGFAPDADLYIFRVFTNKQVSYTSWFLDAFNYALHVGVRLLNLSIGGPDFNDRPFVDKVWELSANGVIVVSAIGNDGPLYGTLNNPADQPDVIAVGGINRDNRMSPFSSRGMTTWELPRGYGRVKPDVVAYAQRLQGSRIDGGCRTLSGTSVASPVVAGAAALLASVVPTEIRWSIVNPASMKQALVHTATRLPGLNAFEQGGGRMDLDAAFHYLRHYSPRVTLFPAALDFTDCPYMWPYCAQPLFATSQPVVANVTVLNGIGSAARFLGAPLWVPDPVPGGGPSPLAVEAVLPPVVWPWAGWMAVAVTVSPAAAASGFEGVASGVLSVQLETYPEGVVSTVELPVTARVALPPPRARRILIDTFHSLRYPSAYVPRDDLSVKDDVLDWNADHPHTNFRSLFTRLVDMGYAVEVLGNDFTCFDAALYGTLLLVDSEDDFHAAEVAKLQRDLRETGLSLLVMADWYDTRVMERAQFFDDNTRMWWSPITGGANIPALNDLLAGFGIAFGGTVYTGTLRLPGESHHPRFASGNAIARFPAHGHLLMQVLRDQSHDVMTAHDAANTRRGRHPVRASVPVAGIVQPALSNGRIAVYGDSNCVDDAHARTETYCWSLLQKLLQYTSDGVVPRNLFPEASQLTLPYHSDRDVPPHRLPDAQTAFNKYSNVHRQDGVGGAHCGFR